MDFPTLAQHCAPDVHVTTLAAVVRHESGFDPLVIGVNTKPPRSIRPRSHAEAVAKVRKLMAAGMDFDVGYGQINVRNWRWLGVTPETILDPCVNLASAQRVLVDCYQRAAKVHGPGQTALYAAFSCYNTGNLKAGFKNGYVGKILAGAGLPVPVIAKAPHPAAKLPEPRPGFSDAFSSPKPDAFDKPRPDVFAGPKLDQQDAEQPRNDDAGDSSVFGKPVLIRRP